MGVVTRAWLGATVAVALWASVVEAADPETNSKPPRVVELEFEVAPDEDVAELRVLSGLTIGDPYRPLVVRRAVQRLYQLGRFENVFVRAATTPHGVRLLLTLPPRRTLQAVQLEADGVLSETEVLAAFQAELNDPFDPRDVPTWEQALQETLVRRGYRDPAVGIAYGAVDETGGIEVKVRIDAGPLTRLNRLIISGRTRKPLWQLDEVIDLDRGDVVELDRVDVAVAELQAYYRAAGYLDARIRMVDVRQVRNTSRADVLLSVEAGPQVTVRFQGNRAVGTRALEEDSELLQDIGTGSAALAEVRERIVGRYERRGYWRVKVEPAVRVTTNGDKKEVLFSIREGRPALVRNLAFPGNSLFRRGRLTDTVVQLVRDALGDASGQPGADPSVVDQLAGTTGRHGRRRQPDTSAPDPRQVYIPRAYRAARDELADLYRARGYQTVEVGEPVITPVPRQDMVDVAIPIRPGVRWEIGVVSFSGNQQVPSLELLDLAGLDLEVDGGQVLAFDDVENARRAILKHYRDLGHLYVRISEELRQMPERGAIGPPPSLPLSVKTSTSAPTDIRRVCAQAESEGKKNCDIELMFSIAEGPRVTTDDVIIKGVETTWQSIIESEIELQPDEVLRASDMEQTRDNLLRLGLFDLVDVRPLDEDEVSDRKDVLVEVKERDHYWFELGIGASTEDGLRGSGAFGDGNLFGSALRFQLQAGVNVWLPPLLVLYNDEIRSQIEPFYNGFGFFERLEYEVAAGLSYPRIPGLPRGFSAGLDVIALRDFDPAFLENTQTVTLLTTYKANSFGQIRWPSFQLRANFELTDLECNGRLRGVPENPNTDQILSDLALLCSTSAPVGDDDPDASFRGSNTYLSVGPRITWDLRDDSIDPKNGAYFEIESFYGFGLDPTSPDYVNVNGRANFYLQLMPRLVLAVSILAGKLFQLGSDDLEIPLNRRLFAGGRTTIRGYAEKTLLPQDTEINLETGEPVAAISTGGQLLAAFKSEFRILLFPSLSLSLFFDAGDLWQDGVLRFQRRLTLEDGTVIRRNFAQGAGVGLRVATPIGPLAIDLAVPVNRRDPGSSSPQLHFAVGSF